MRWAGSERLSCFPRALRHSALRHEAQRRAVLPPVVVHALRDPCMHHWPNFPPQLGQLRLRVPRLADSHRTEPDNDVTAVTLTADRIAHRDSHRHRRVGCTLRSCFCPPHLLADAAPPRRRVPPARGQRHRYMRGQARIPTEWNGARQRFIPMHDLPPTQGWPLSALRSVCALHRCVRYLEGGIVGMAERSIVGPHRLGTAHSGADCVQRRVR